MGSEWKPNFCHSSESIDIKCNIELERPTTFWCSYNNIIELREEENAYIA